jgi:hypothetical protein
LIVKRGDSYPFPIAELTNGPDDPVNLNGATVNFRMAGLDGTPRFERGADILDPDNGIVQYPWQIGDTDVVGAFRAEWEVQFDNGALQTFPQAYILDILIKEKAEL